MAVETDLILDPSVAKWIPLASNLVRYGWWYAAFAVLLASMAVIGPLTPDRSAPASALAPKATAPTNDAPADRATPTTASALPTNDTSSDLAAAADAAPSTPASDSAVASVGPVAEPAATPAYTQTPAATSPTTTASGSGQPSSPAPTKTTCPADESLPQPVAGPAVDGLGKAQGQVGAATGQPPPDAAGTASKAAGCTGGASASAARVTPLQAQLLWRALLGGLIW